MEMEIADVIKDFANDEAIDEFGYKYGTTDYRGVAKYKLYVDLNEDQLSQLKNNPNSSIMGILIDLSPIASIVPSVFIVNIVIQVEVYYYKVQKYIICKIQVLFFQLIW